MTQVFTSPPQGFSPCASISACYLESDGKLLLLRRSEGKKEGGRWGVPAGKAEEGETPVQTALRELREETGIVAVSHDVQNLGCLFVRKPESDYTYHMFRLMLPSKPPILLNSGEHEEHRWVAVHELEALPLMAGAKSAYLRYCQAIPGAKKRTTASVSSYLILKRESDILLGLRQNTGYCDGMWSFPAGHVEEGESATAGMIREAEEEIGIRLHPAHLKTVHIMHRQSNRFNIDIFFTCTKWEGEIENREWEKCLRLQFFPLNALPENMVVYNRHVLEMVNQEIFYTESGWD